MSGKDKDKKVSAEDRELFRQSVGKIKRVQDDRVHTRPKPARPRRSRQDDTPRESDGTLSDDYALPDAGEAEELFFARPGLQPRMIKRLRQGKVDIRADLDLHGMVVDEAREAVAEFLAYCSESRIRGAIIIHGKGYRSGTARLKSMVNRWLRQHPAVLAFCSAQPRDGGTGAVYVLIKQG